MLLPRLVEMWCLTVVRDIWHEKDQEPIIRYGPSLAIDRYIQCDVRLVWPEAVRPALQRARPLLAESGHPHQEPRPSLRHHQPPRYVVVIPSSPIPLAGYPSTGLSAANSSSSSHPAVPYESFL